MVKVSDAKGYVASSVPGQGQGQVQARPWRPDEASNWCTECGHLGSSHLTKSGLDIGRCEVLVHVKLLLGFLRHPDGTVVRQYSTEDVLAPLQVSAV